MALAITALTLTAVLLFSLSCALLLEEMIFGGLFRLFFTPQVQPARVKAQEERKHRN